MQPNSIHIIYHPSAKGYAAYSRELDGINAEAATVEELFDKVKHLIEVRAQSLMEIGRPDEALALQQREIIFVEG